MVRTQVQLTEDEYRSLKELASKLNLSMAALIRKAVDDLLSSQGPGREEARRRALAVVGAFPLGRTDVAERHDDYLAQAYESPEP